MDNKLSISFSAQTAFLVRLNGRNILFLIFLFFINWLKKLCVIQKVQEINGITKYKKLLCNIQNLKRLCIFKNLSCFLDPF